MKYFLLALFLIVEICEIHPQISNRIQLVDAGTKKGVAFAYIRFKNHNITINSDEDGYFQISPKIMDSIEITHVAYMPKKVFISGSRELSIIELHELPVELNPIIVSANTAKTAVTKAISSSSGVLSFPKVLRSFREDVILFKDTLVADARAEILISLEKLYQPGKGTRNNCYLHNIYAKRNIDFKHRVIPSYSLIPTFVPVNHFIAGYSKSDDNLIYFSFQEVNDSLIIITFKPSLSYRPDKKTFVKHGRFLINSKTGMFLRIDSYVSPETLRRTRSVLSTEKDPKEFMYEYSLSQFFDNNGFPTEIQWRYSFSYGKDDPEELWQHRTRMVLVNENTNTLKPDESQYLKPDSVLVQLRSRFDPDFEARFNMYFPPESSFTE